MKEKVKRAVDVVFSIIALSISLPMISLISGLIYLTMGRPIFFKQVRPGLYGKPFVLYKFRTMHELKNEKGQYLPDESRITTIGKLIRKYSIDELPELWNVLLGDMSLVGPRPLLLRYLPYFSAAEKLRFMMKPGLTGWAQINGRNKLSWEERLSLDIWYVKNWTLLLDFKILIMTVINAMRHKDLIVLPNSYMLDLDEERKHKVS